MTPATSASPKSIVLPASPAAALVPVGVGVVSALSDVGEAGLVAPAVGAGVDGATDSASVVVLAAELIDVLAAELIDVIAAELIDVLVGLDEAVVEVGRGVVEELVVPAAPTTSFTHLPASPE